MSQKNGRHESRARRAFPGIKYRRDVVPVVARAGRVVPRRRRRRVRPPGAREHASDDVPEDGEARPVPRGVRRARGGASSSSRRVARILSFVPSFIPLHFTRRRSHPSALAHAPPLPSSRAAERPAERRALDARARGRARLSVPARARPRGRGPRDLGAEVERATRRGRPRDSGAFVMSSHHTGPRTTASAW